MGWCSLNYPGGSQALGSKFFTKTVETQEQSRLGFVDKLIGDKTTLSSKDYTKTQRYKSKIEIIWKVQLYTDAQSIKVS